MASSVDYHDDRSNFTHDAISSTSHGYHMSSGNSSAPAPAAGAVLAEPYAFMSPSPSGYTEQSYYINSHPTGSAADHERELNSNHSDPALNDGTGGEYTMVSRHIGESGSDYGVGEESRAILPDETEPQAELDNYVEDVVQPGFDEAILRALCDMDVSASSRRESSSMTIHTLLSQVGIPLLLDRIKQSMTSCRVLRSFCLAPEIPLIYFILGSIGIS